MINVAIWRVQELEIEMAFHSGEIFELKKI